MRVRYGELIGKEVVDAEGKRVGRIADVVAEPERGRLRVTALLVGAGALAARIGFKRFAFLAPMRALTIPWDQVAAVGDQVQLRPGASWEDMAAASSRPAKRAGRRG